MQIEWIPNNQPINNYSPGASVGRGVVDMIVLHHMAGYMAGSIARFQDPNAHASAHYLAEDGRVVQMISDADVAYHAGNWAVNLRSIGIENSGNAPLNGGGISPITEATVQSCIELATQLCITHKINPYDKLEVIYWSGSDGGRRSHMVYRLCCHHDVDQLPGNTGCPGNLPVDRIRAAVAANLNGTDSVAAPTPTPTPVRQQYVFTQYLTPGMNGNTEVARLQRCLQILGYFPKDVDCTGNYGTITSKSVFEFQKDAGIMSSKAVYGTTTGAGWFGPLTRTALTNKNVAAQ